METDQQEFQQFLDESNQHLTDEVISNYINIKGIFEEKEREFIRGHLEDCAHCRERFNHIFDGSFIDDDSIDLSLLHFAHEESEPDERIFTDDSGNVKLILKKNENIYSIIPFHLPANLAGRKAKISVPDLDLTFRILELRKNTKSEVDHPSEKEFALSKSVLIESIRTEEVPVFETESQKSYPWRNIIFISGGIIAAAIILFMMLNRPEESMSDEDHPIYAGENDPQSERSKTEDQSLNDTTVSAAITDTAVVVRPEDVPIADNFSENYVLENLIAETGNEVTAVSPRNENISIPVTFRWIGNGRTNQYRLLIVDNKNSVKYQSTIVGNSVTYSGTLKPGLYYWKVEIGNKTAAANKFRYNP